MAFKIMWCLALITMLQLVEITTQLDISQCITPLGMENGIIRDEYITASSSFDHKNVGPHRGRVRNELHGGAWCPLTPATPDLKEWLEIDLQEVHMITAAGTQGRFGNGQGVEFTESYILEYWRPRLNKWIRYYNRTGNEVMKGNLNTYLESKTHLDPPIFASKIRFLPFSYHSRTVCMRVEIYGCRWSEGILSYSMPQGDKRGSSWEFYDVTYDGHWEGDKLQHGLGQLIDGHVANEDFKVAFYDFTNQGWIGWKNDTKQNRTIEIIFEFDRVREFNAVHIYCNNQFTKDVQVFSEARVYFSIGGRHYKGEPTTYDYIEDRIFETPRNVSMKLHHRVGRFVKIQLSFASRWILISEVTFDSIGIEGNFTVEQDDEKTSSNDQIYTPGIINKDVISAENSHGTIGDYLGIAVGVLLVLVLIMIFAIVVVIMKQRRYKSSLRPSQVPSGCDKAVLYQEPSVGKCSQSSDYADIKDSEYAVPLQPSTQNYRYPPTLMNFLPKPPPSEQYYAATEICNDGFIPPPPLLSTPPPVRLSRQPRYVSNSSKLHIGP